ncbi:hypothetical protein [Nocardia sp. NPDC057030]|uniref:hypothetical protein n=1 Tax=unclassified Nocardia TaxID=2637762 RepID=UPI0036432AF2
MSTDTLDARLDAIRAQLAAVTATPDASDRWTTAYAEAQRLAHEVEVLERKVAERDRVRLTRDDVIGAVAVRTAVGWHKVVRVNKTTVSCASGYSWTDKFAFDKILEVRKG